MSTEILTLVLTGVVVWIAFKYINRDEESSWKEKVLVWLKNLIARPGGVVIRLVINQLELNLID